MAHVQLRLNTIDGFDQVFLIADRERHARNGMLYGHQRLVYCGLLLPVHGENLNPFSPGCKPRGASRRRTPESKEPRGCPRGSLRVKDQTYFGGALEDELEADLSLLLSLLFLWCLLLLWLFFEESDVDDEDAGVDEAAGVEGAGAGVDCAKAGPAIRASAITGMSFLNIDVVSRRIVGAVHPPSAAIMPALPQSKRHMTAT
jgi:hypothetical protein